MIVFALINLLLPVAVLSLNKTRTVFFVAITEQGSGRLVLHWLSPVCCGENRAVTGCDGLIFLVSRCFVAWRVVSVFQGAAVAVGDVTIEFFPGSVQLYL